MAISRICSITDCGKPARARGWCNAHWRRWSRHGNPLKGNPPLMLNHGPFCSIEGCGRPYYGRGFCQRHWERWNAHGDPLAGALGPIEAREYLETVVLAYKGEDCLIWPYSRDEHGYGQITIKRKKHKLSRYVCTKAHGEPPTPKHQAAHSCGKGHLACVAKGHLSWKTRAENEADKIIHGTHNRGQRHGMSKLTDEAVLQIRSLKGKMTQQELGDKYGVSSSTIGLILSGARWAHLSIKAG